MQSKSTYLLKFLRNRFCNLILLLKNIIQYHPGTAAHTTVHACATTMHIHPISQETRTETLIDQKSK
jgi:hypothetical protein